MAMTMKNLLRVLRKEKTSLAASRAPPVSTVVAMVVMTEASTKYKINMGNTDLAETFTPLL